MINAGGKFGVTSEGELYSESCTMTKGSFTGSLVATGGHLKDTTIENANFTEVDAISFKNNVTTLTAGDLGASPVANNETIIIKITGSSNYYISSDRRVNTIYATAYFTDALCCVVGECISSCNTIKIDVCSMISSNSYIWHKFIARA